MERYARFNYQPCLPLSSDGRRVTGSKEHAQLSKEAACEGTVLLKNENGALPLKNGRKVALFGKATIEYIKGGGGSGDVNCAYIRNIYDGFSLKEREGKVKIFMPSIKFYEDYVKKAGKNIPTREQIERTWDKVNAMDFCKEKDDIIYDTFKSMHVKEPFVPKELVIEASKNAETAIVTFSRFSAEGVDRRPTEGDYYLSAEEKNLLDLLCEYFKETVVVINSGGVVDCEYFAEKSGVSAVIYAWQGGMEGGAALADIICGDKNPSGKLCDTVPKSYSFYANAEEFLTGFEHLDYFDDIYVGYRYFETVPGGKEKVRYPFGFGLSYTSFSLDGVLAGESGGKITAAVTVKNIGTRPGKEVVQLYYSAPQGLLKKPARELAAFKKTKLLSPGESETLALSFELSDMASFDDLGKIKKSAYVLEKGEYRFFIGNSVRSAEEIPYKFVCEKDVITKQASELLKPFALSKRMLSGGSFEELPQEKPHYLEGRAKPFLQKAPEETVMFTDIPEKASLEEFIKQLTDDELVDLLGGHGNQPGVCNTGAFGGLKRLKIPAVPTADGPAGLRLNANTGVFTTAWPCAALLACTFNTDLIFKIGEAGGEELKENNLGVWLAPAMNIHRNPLCGRNFEYFSEDPLLAGKCCAAQVRGIQSNKIAASVKHFACNNRESNRFECDSRVSQRALREIYLRGFEICVKEADPWTVMSSYNLINGKHTSESYELLTKMLREEWGFKGMVTTDWGAHSEHCDDVLAGGDMKMGEGDPENLKAALNSGKLLRSDLEACAKRVLELFLKFE